MLPPRLLAAVEEAFVRAGAGLPHWPDPHPGGTSPAQDEYSRVLDPGKWRLIGARADAVHRPGGADRFVVGMTMTCPTRP